MPMDAFANERSVWSMACVLVEVSNELACRPRYLHDRRPSEIRQDRCGAAKGESVPRAAIASQWRCARCLSGPWYL